MKASVPIAAPVSTLALLVLLVASASCVVDGDSSGGAFLCTDECPAPLQCVGGRCVADDPGQDSGPNDAPEVDAGECVCSDETAADTCGAAPLLASGELICASTENNGNAVLGCPANPMPGSDAAYRVSAASGQTLTATVRPIGFDAAVYVTQDCSGTCVEIANELGSSGTETVSVVIATAGDYFVIVDSPTGLGCYELTVTVD